MKAPWKKEKYPQRYYKVMAVRETLRNLEDELKEDIWHPKIKSQLRTINGILHSMMLEFSKGK